MAPVKVPNFNSLRQERFIVVHGSEGIFHNGQDSKLAGAHGPQDSWPREHVVPLVYSLAGQIAEKVQTGEKVAEGVFKICLWLPVFAKMTTSSEIFIKFQNRATSLRPRAQTEELVGNILPLNHNGPLLM